MRAHLCRSLCLAGLLSGALFSAPALADSQETKDTAEMLERLDRTGAIEGDQGKKIGAREQTRYERASRSVLSDEYFAQLDAAILKYGYPVVTENFKTLPTDPKMLLWLERKVKEGHAFLAWVLADRMLSENVKEALHWGMVAVLATRQEAALCYDPKLRAKVSSNLSAEFPSVGQASKNNPYDRSKTMREAIVVLRSLEARLPDPSWLCARYPSLMNPRAPMLVYPAKFYPHLRATERNALIDALRLEGIAKETVPPEPEPLP